MVRHFTQSRRSIEQKTPLRCQSVQTCLCRLRLRFGSPSNTHWRSRWRPMG